MHSYLVPSTKAFLSSYAGEAVEQVLVLAAVHREPGAGRLQREHGHRRGDPCGRIRLLTPGLAIAKKATVLQEAWAGPKKDEHPGVAAKAESSAVQAACALICQSCTADKNSRQTMARLQAAPVVLLGWPKNGETDLPGRRQCWWQRPQGPAAGLRA